VVDTSHPLNAVHKPATTGIVGNNVKKGKLATDDTERRIDCIKKNKQSCRRKAWCRMFIGKERDFTPAGVHKCTSWLNLLASWEITLENE